jgi:hypothetical protein
MLGNYEMVFKEEEEEEQQQQGEQVEGEPLSSCLLAANQSSRRQFSAFLWAANERAWALASDAPRYFDRARLGW